MNIYWYWPFMHEDELPWAPATARADDRIVVHTLARPYTIPVDHGRVSTLSTLPDVDRALRERSPAWMLSRPWTYVRRSALRRRELNSHAFDIAHIMFLNPFTDWYALGALRRRCPLVLSVHDALPHQRRLPKALERLVLERTIRSADHVIVHHSYVQTRLEQLYGLGRSRVSVIPLPVPTVPNERTPSNGRLRVLFFGTLRPNKGIEVLLAALQAMPCSAAIHVRIAGSGSPAMNAYVADAAEGISFLDVETGWISQERKTELYADSDVVVLPYTSFESQSGVLRDAYAAGLAAVASDIGALGYTVRDDSSGLVVPPGDPGALAAALLSLCDDDTMVTKLGAAARRAGERATFSRVGEELREVYDVVTQARLQHAHGSGQDPT